MDLKLYFENIMENGTFAPVFKGLIFKAPDKVHITTSKMPISLPSPMFDHLLESSHQDDSNK